MDGSGKEIGEHRMDRTVPLERSPPPEAVAHDLEAQVQARTPARMMPVPRGLVPQQQTLGGEGLTQPLLDFEDQRSRCLIHRAHVQGQRRRIVPQGAAMA
jgi:hypothetical protein